MKKALQLAGLRAGGSVSERAAVGAVGETQRDRFFELFAKLFVLDSGRQPSGRLECLRRRGDRARGGRLGWCERELGKVSLGEAERLRGNLAELGPQPFEDRRRELTELEGPH